MNHSFEVGKEYRNRNGIYEVVAIQEPKMLIRYEDGRQDVVTIDVQARIWQAIKDEAQQQQEVGHKSTGSTRARRQTAHQGYHFSGLLESDFKNNVSGTHWRSRDSLGGRLAQHLSETTPYEFQSYAIYRRPSVYIYIPDQFDPSDGVPYAKYEFRLSPAGAQYGFYVERADDSRAMDGTWHWWAFLGAIETDSQLQKRLQNAMQEHELYWSLQLEEPGEKGNYSFTKIVNITAGAPLLWNDIEAVDWAEFAQRLRATPSHNWLNVHLCGWTDKSEALGAAERFADQVTPILAALLPLYVEVTGA
jgi:hypothetical protein